MTVQASIIICTRDRADALQKTITSIEQCANPSAISIEILIIDNGSIDHTSKVAKAAAIRNQSIRYVFEPCRGQAYARNCGLTASRGEIIIFTDDDICVPPSWLSGLCEPLHRGDVDAVQGGIRMASHLQRAWMTGLHKSMLADVTEKVGEPVSVLVGANMAFNRRVLAKVKKFDVNLGPGALGFCDDTFFSMMLLAEGYKLGWAHGSTVIHHFDPQRLSRKSWYRRSTGEGKSYAYLVYVYGGYKSWSALPRWIICNICLLNNRIRSLVGLNGRPVGPAAESELRIWRDRAFHWQILKCAFLRKRAPSTGSLS